MQNQILFLAGLAALALLPDDTNAQDDMSGVLKFHYDELVETEKEVNAYTSPKERLYMVSGARYEYFLRSISPKARKDWDAQWLTNPVHKKTFEAKYSAIAKAAAKKMTVYLPVDENFAVHNPAEEKLMKAKLKNATTLKIHKIGQVHSTWQISKGSDGLPESRYKQGYIWARDSSDDHGFCHLYQVNIKQDYSGGGTYGESYAILIDDSLRGCPQ